MANNVIDIFNDDPHRAMNQVRQRYQSVFSDDMLRAAEIAEEEYEKFLGEAGNKGISGILVNADVVVKKKRKSQNIERSIVVGIPTSGDNPANLIFHVLDEGREALGSASKYGMKAWPIVLPRQQEHGNIPLSNPHSPDLQTAYSGEDVIFRPVIENAIEARDFTTEIQKRIQKRLEDEGIGFIRVDVDKQGL